MPSSTSAYSSSQFSPQQLPQPRTSPPPSSPPQSPAPTSSMRENFKFGCATATTATLISFTSYLTAKNRYPKQQQNNYLHYNNHQPQRHRRSNDVERAENLEQKSELLKESQTVSCTGKINAGEDDEMFITGYRRSPARTAFCWLCVLFTAGLLRLFMHWWRHWLLLATHIPCPLDIAEKLLISENYEGKHTVYYVKDVHTLTGDFVQQMHDEKTNNRWCNFIPYDKSMDGRPFQLAIHFAGGIFKHMDSIRIFKCKQLRYIWDVHSAGFVKLKGLDTNVPSFMLHQQRGLTNDEQYARRLVYGYNQIVIPLHSILRLLFLEVLNPFYVFQVFSVCLWFSYNYYYYAAVIVLMSIFGISMSIIQTRKNQLALYSTVTSNDFTTVINKDGQSLRVETKNLVPGDILEIPSSGCTMQCDAVLISGNCILDESMLTGESVPVTKTPLPCKRELIFDLKDHARHVLFCGTKVIQTRYIGTEKVLAIVINTGNITAKGGLVRSILYPPPVDYKFEQDSYKFIMLLALAAFTGFLYTLITKILRGVPATKIAIESLDLITIAVPPALPAAMTVGRYYAQKRLEKNHIYCISPRSINVSGSIDCVCFDKTGTLTEDGLDMWGVVPKSTTNSFQIPFQQVDRLPSDHLLFGMVTCHSITIMNGELKGDPLDLKMFESTGWLLEEANVSDDTKYDLLFPTIVRPPPLPQQSVSCLDEPMGIESDSDSVATTGCGTSLDIGIVREFTFTSSLQRMSVITRKLMDTHFNVYCKGSPEMILTLCKSETIPHDFHEKLDIYAQQGYRIIAIAYKALDKKMTYAKVQRISREKIEIDLEFLGFVILENRLKNDTTAIINNLLAANIRTIMVTGDNILTALSVAKDCEMITNGQSVITVNARPHPDHADKYELFYHLTGTPGRPSHALNYYDGRNDRRCNERNDGIQSIDGDAMNMQTFNGMVGEYGIITNSNSVASFDTIDTCTQTTNITTNSTVYNLKHHHLNTRHDDLEYGYKNRKKLINQYEDDDPLKLVPELPSNNYRFAMIGKTWSIIRDHFPELLPKFVTRGTVFARMSPDQKQALILELQELGYYVAMCGDGANDCGALKAAHTGISLSEAESSVASPFTSKNPTIACVPNVIKEGRAALVTSIGIFKYMAAYSLVQFTSVLILYSIDSNLTDMEFLYIDLFIISIIAFFFGKTESYDGPLVKQTPLNSLISLSPILSLVFHLLLTCGFQVIGWFHLRTQPWFQPYNYTEEMGMHHGCHENYTIFTISCFQYIILAFVFSKGAPYRKTILTNYGFLMAVVLNVAFSIYMTLGPFDALANLFELIMPPDMLFRTYIVIYGLVNFIFCLFIEVVIVENILSRKMRYRFHNIEKSRRKYLSIENYLRQNPSWPPLSLLQNNLNAYGGERGDGMTTTTTTTTFAEICVESNVVDSVTLFDQSNSVLNSFFDTICDTIVTPTVPETQQSPPPPQSMTTFETQLHSSNLPPSSSLSLSPSIAIDTLKTLITPRPIISAGVLYNAPVNYVNNDDNNVAVFEKQHASRSENFNNKSLKTISVNTIPLNGFKLPTNHNSTDLDSQLSKNNCTNESIKQQQTFNADNQHQKLIMLDTAIDGCVDGTKRLFNGYYLHSQNDSHSNIIDSCKNIDANVANDDFANITVKHNQSTELIHHS